MVMARRRRQTKAEAGARPAASSEPQGQVQASPVVWSVSPRLAAIVVVVMAVTALCVRALPIWSDIFPASGEVRLLGVDPYFHLRHSRFAAQHFPNLQRWDIGTHYPNGLFCDAVSLYNLAIGGASCIIGGGQPTDALVERVSAWTPPVLAAASVVALYLLARTAVGRLAALVACAVFMLYPGSSLHRTLLGFPDHHCAEILLGLLAVWGVARCLRSSGDDPSVRSLWRPAVLHAAPLAVFCFTWAGAPIYLLITALALWAVATAEVLHRAGAPATAVAAFRYGCGLYAIVAGAGWLWPQLVMAPGHFPLLLRSCVIIAVAPALFHAAARLLARARVGPRLSVAILTSLGVASLWLATQHVRGAPLLLWQLLEKGRNLAEHQPVTFDSFWSLLGMAGLLASIAVPLVVARVVRDSGRRYALVSVVPGALLTSLWIYSYDYDYAPPPFVALLSAFVIRELGVRLFPGGMPGAARTRWAVAAVAALLFIGPVWPLQHVRVPWATARLAREHVIISDGWVQAMDWLRDNTPEPSLSLDTPVGPWHWVRGFQYPAGTYGVFCPWDFGNMVSALGRRVPVSSRFPSPQTARWILSEDESRSVELLCPDCRDDERVRYVVLEARTVAQHFLAKAVLLNRPLEEYDTRDRDWFTVKSGGPSRVLHRTHGPRYQRSMAVRLYLNDGRDVGHYRLVYESPHQSYITYRLEDTAHRVWRTAYPIDSAAEHDAFSARIGSGSIARVVDHYEYDGVITSTVKIFECVAGARLTGLAAPGSTVEAHLAMQCGSDRRLVPYRRTTVAGTDGRFELTVAHPTESPVELSACGAKTPYRVFVRATPEARPTTVYAIAVDDDQVRSGAQVELGPLR